MIHLCYYSPFNKVVLFAPEHKGLFTFDNRALFSSKYDLIERYLDYVQNKKEITITDSKIERFTVLKTFYSMGDIKDYMPELFI